MPVTARIDSYNDTQCNAISLCTAMYFRLQKKRKSVEVGILIALEPPNEEWREVVTVSPSEAPGSTESSGSSGSGPLVGWPAVTIKGVRRL